VSCEDAGWHGAYPQLARTEEARGSNPLTSTPQSAGQSAAHVERAALSACCGRAAAATSSHSAAQRLSEASRPRPRPHTMTTQRGHRQLPPDRRSSRASSLSRSATRSAWPTANHLPRRRPRPSRPSAGPARPVASFERQAPTSADDAPSWTWRATTPTPANPAVRRPAPPPHPATSCRRTPRTPQRTDAGGRTLDSWTLRRRTGHRSRGHAPVDTGRLHRTLDTGCRTRTRTR
jgi:hypothetical protein